MSFLITLGIIIGIVIISIIILNHFFTKGNIIYDDMLNAKKHNKVIKNSNLPNMNLSNFATSVWFYIDDWEFNYGQRKNIMYFSKTADAKNIDFNKQLDSIHEGNIDTPSIPNLKNISIFLGEFENNLHIEIETFHNNNVDSKTLNASSKTMQTASITEYVIPNVEVQKWVCLTLSVDTRTMDVYLDGKLVNSYVLPGVYKPSPDNNVFLGNLGSGGFGGFVTRFRYINRDISPEQSYAIYKDGINASMLGNAFNKYRLKVSFLEYDTPKGSFTI
jgi:hypothetical protein